MATANLLQSFTATPDRPVPELWRRRLGEPLAMTLWQRQRRSWWQFWGAHGEGGAYLAIPLSTTIISSPGSTPANSLRVGNLLVVAPDPLSRQLLEDRLRPRIRPSRGLQRRCLPLLQNGQAVFWSPAAVGDIAGQLAAFLQGFQEGCLELSLEQQGLFWRGEAAAVDGVLLDSSPPAIDPAQALQPPLAGDLLLELEGPELRLLFEGLLSRRAIREPLEDVYGIDATSLDLLRASPFRLRLRSKANGPFQASLELQVITRGSRQKWQGLLNGLATRLEQRGYRSSPPGDVSAGEVQSAKRSPSVEVTGPGSKGRQAAGPTPGAGPTPPAGKDPEPSAGEEPDALAATWTRDDGAVVGGWRWIQPTEGQPQLLLFLGPVPTIPLPLEAATAEEQPVLRLRARPRELDALGLLPVALPAVVKGAEQFSALARPLAGGSAQRSVSQLMGRLLVKK
jgi:hypothetical protein